MGPTVLASSKTRNEQERDAAAGASDHQSARVVARSKLERLYAPTERTERIGWALHEANLAVGAIALR